MSMVPTQRPSGHPTPRSSLSRVSAGPVPHPSLRPAHLIRVSTTSPRIPANPRLYSWEDLATMERRAVLALVNESRRQRRRTRRRTLILTLLLMLLIVAFLSVVVFGLAPALTLSF